MKNLFLVLFLLPVSLLRASALDSAKALLDHTGYVDAMLNMPWQEWQKLSPDQRKLFEDRCEYNRELIETELAEFLVQNFSVNELDALGAFYRSDVGHKWTIISGSRGGFETPALFKASSRWQDGRYSEARSYVASLESKQAWRPTGYRGQVGNYTAKRGGRICGCGLLGFNRWIRGGFHGQVWAAFYA